MPRGEWMEAKPQKTSRLSRAIRRHPALLVLIFAVTASTVFLAAPSLKRTYTLDANARIRGGGKPVDAQLVLNTVLSSNSRSTLSASVQESAGAPTLHLQTTASSRSAAIVRMQTVADQFQLAYLHAGEEAQAASLAQLQKQANHLTEEVKSLTAEAEQFRMQNPGILADDPRSIVAQSDAVTTRFDEKRQRQQIVTDQIGRLEAYQTRLKTSVATHEIPPPPPPLPASTASSTTVTGSAENDPEVISLTAQMQLLNTQIDEQLNTMHRTDQHPYVVDLRTQQANLQKKLDAAKDRVAAGKPPPPPESGRVAMVAPSRAASGDSAMASTQVELQLEALRAEKGALDSELKQLEPQKAELQKQVTALLPLRDKYATMQSDLRAKQQALQMAKTALAAAGPTTGDESSVIVGVPLMMPRVQGVTLEGLSDSVFPSWPGLPLIYGAGVGVGIVTAGIAAWLLTKGDRAIHDPTDAASVLEVPILGTVSALYSRGQVRRMRLWNFVGQPLAVCLLLVVTVATAFLCYRRLGETGFSERQQAMGISAFASPALGEVRP